MRSGWVGRIGTAAADSNEVALQKRLAVVLCAGTLPLTALWSVIYLLMDAPLAAVAPVFYTVFAVTRRTQTDAAEDRRLRRATAHYGTAAAAPTPTHLPDTFVTWFFVLNLGTVIAVVFGLLHYFVRRRDFFEESSEMLLLNNLPKEISEALKTEPRAIAAHYDEASILFADIVGFTPMAANMLPLTLVDLLNDVFECFDDLVDKYELEKIKTIGDCYMVAAGVPRQRVDHAEALVNFALDMRAEVGNRTFGGRRLAFRIGINSGPVVAGVIGRRKFIYDLWGETVNMASRMESHGTSGVIQITRGTFDRVSAHFDCQARGPIEVKGVGRVETWYVTGRTLTA